MQSEGVQSEGVQSVHTNINFVPIFKSFLVIYMGSSITLILAIQGFIKNSKYSSPSLNVNSYYVISYNVMFYSGKKKFP